jgi:hypothetical protein
MLGSVHALCVAAKDTCWSVGACSIGLICPPSFALTAVSFLRASLHLGSVVCERPAEMNVSMLIAARPSIKGSALAIRNPVYVYRFSRALFLAQVLCCTAPAMVLLTIGQSALAAKCFWLLFGLVLIRIASKGRRDELLGTLIAGAPFMNLLRGYVFYNVLLVTFGLALTFYFFGAASLCKQTAHRFKLWPGLLIWTGVYYSVSFFNTRDYSVNLRMFELAFASFALLLISRHPQLLGAALLGMVVSALLVGAAMLPHINSASQRLGMMETDGQTLGNPAQLGLPLAIGFLGLIIDRGKWLNLHFGWMRRWGVLLPTTVLLVLTTSRMSWLVAAAGLLTLFLIGKRQRRVIAVAALVVTGAIGLLAISPYNGVIKKGWARTFGENRSASKRTSGRSDQWIVSGYAMTRSLNTLVRGYGPGTGAEVYGNYSREVRGIKYSVGKKVVLHSLFMQIMVETGLVGLLILFGWLLMFFVKLIEGLRYRSWILPLACFSGYCVTVITVSGNDINSGILLGISLIGSESEAQRL